MNKGLTFGATWGIGTGLMYLADPDRVKRRRAHLRDKFVSATRETGEGIDTTPRHQAKDESNLTASEAGPDARRSRP